MTTDTSQPALWGGTAGNAWAELQDLLDRIFHPFEALLAAGLAPRQRVLDIGCGTGSTTLAAARRVGLGGHCTGIDISAPMLAVAARRAQEESLAIDFVQADAQRHAFAPAAFDALISRFGVMFFDDPVAAFARLHQAARHGAPLHVFAWRAAADNPFMTAAERAAAPLIALPASVPGQPGQFAFADAARVRAILDASGWSDVAVVPADVPCAFPAAALERYITRMGIVGRVLPTLDAATRQAVLAAMRPAFEPFIDGDQVRFTAACWQITARAAHTVR
ncbi:class I SAM-dependent methyltransferase [Pseudoduganella buxea]|nr:class I SAM-dependent methyltransferase [Pseudoduganella buxea]GGB96168.1 hypothetical protein GCM10011572_17690 [Pseudoduganella buxea]